MCFYFENDFKYMRNYWNSNLKIELHLCMWNVIRWAETKNKKYIINEKKQTMSNIDFIEISQIYWTPKYKCIIWKTTT